MVLKFGLVGMIIYLFIIFKFFRRLVNVKAQMSNVKVDGKLRVTDYKLRIGFALALVALLAVNIFSPYLNHPLGIGFIILISALILL